MICLWIGLSGFNSLASFASRFRAVLAVECSSCFVSVINPDLYVFYLDPLKGERSVKRIE